MKILLFGGTTEGRLLAERLVGMGHQVTVSVATELGAEILQGQFCGPVLTGRMDLEAMAKLLPSYDLCVDATHPYAVKVTKQLQAACAAAGVPLRRLLRKESGQEGCMVVDSCAQAASFLQKQRGNVLLTTGAKELGAFAALEPDRLFPRVLPTHASLSACEALGIPHRNILALQGPFSQEMNAAMLAQYQIRWLVTKDGGAVGGYEEKYAAAQERGVPVILIDHHPDGGPNPSPGAGEYCLFGRAWGDHGDFPVGLFAGWVTGSTAPGGLYPADPCGAGV